MLSLSTSWNSSRHTSGFSMIDEIRALGFETVELNFALTEAVVRDVLSMKESGAIKISSVHNMCPLPDDIEPSRASPDYYSLSSSDEKERLRAVAVAMNTIEFAKKLGAPAVVLHAGRVEMRDRTRELAAAASDAARLAGIRSELSAERNAKKGIYLDNVMKSLDELVRHAQCAGVALGVENRYYYREIPVIDELEAMFRRFGPGDLYYWHDVGHAEVFDRLGLCRHKDLLDKFSGRLIGMHLHDIIGPAGDHKAPGQGTFDFHVVKPYIRPDTIMVMEAHPPATADDIRNGAAHLAGIFGKV